MKFVTFPKILFCFALVLISASCARSLNRHGQEAFEAPIITKSDQGTRTDGTQTFSPNVAVDLGDVREALASHERGLSRNGDSRSAALTELARLCFILGEYGKKAEGQEYFERGRSYAELLRREQPHRVEGHYWLALNIAGMAEAGGAGRALRLVPLIIEHLKAALTIDGTYDQGGPHRVLGRVYCQAPDWPLSEGDITKALQHLNTAVEIAPENSTNRLYLAETLIQLGKREEAFLELERVLAACHTVWPHPLEEDHRQAARLMEQFRKPDGELLVRTRNRAGGGEFLGCE